VFLLKRTQSPVLDIDISSTSSKLLELSRNGAGLRVENHALEPVSPNAIAEKMISNADAVGGTNRKAIKRTGTKSKYCALAVSGSAVMTKITTMPVGLKGEEMAAQIQLEADQYIPYALDEVNLDFEVLGSTEGSADTVDVLLAASGRGNVQLCMPAAEHAGLTAKIMDQAASQEGTNIELKKAVLSLEVMPQITPDDRIILDLAVRNDSIGKIFLECASSIDMRGVCRRRG
jgi:type IV pilus assembly protein PilM